VRGRFLAPRKKVRAEMKARISPKTVAPLAVNPTLYRPLAAALNRPSKASLSLTSKPRLSLKYMVKLWLYFEFAEGSP